MIRRLTYLSLLLAFCASIVLVSSTFAVDTTFSAAVSSDWNDASNWDTGAVPTAGDNIFVGSGTSSGGAFPGPITVDLSSDPLNPVIDDIRVGHEANGVGTVNHSAGTLATSDLKWSFIGVDGRADAPANGTYNLSGSASLLLGISDNEEFYVGAFGDGGVTTGLVTVADQASLRANRMYIADGGAASGTVTQTGGSVEVEDWLAVGRGGGATGTYNMSGGSLAVNTDWMTVGEGSTGTANVSGTADINLTTGFGLIVGRNDDGVGFFNIDGNSATIDATQLYVGVNDTAADTAATGTLSYTSDASGVSPIITTGDVVFGDMANLVVDLSAGPAFPTDVLLVDVGGSLTGGFAGLPEGALVPGAGGRTITYAYGDGNNIALVPEPASFLTLVLSGLAFFGLLRRR